jgi:hypothetical protein
MFEGKYDCLHFCSPGPLDVIGPVFQKLLLELDSNASSDAAFSSVSLSSRLKPTLVLHIGPTKTGSTFLQCTLSTFAAAAILKSDHYVYIGTDGNCTHHCSPEESKRYNLTLLKHTHETQESFSILEGGVERDPPELTQELKDMLDRLNRNRTNAILVFELFESYFQPKHIHALAKAFLPSWHVQVVVSYRHFFDWYASLYNEYWKPTAKWNGLVDLWPDEVTKNGVRGKEIKPFDIEGRGALSQIFQWNIEADSHPAQRIRNKFAEFFDDISVIDLTHLKSTSLLEKFLCHVLRNATNACKAVRTGGFPAGVYANPSFPMNYDRLATNTYQKGLLHSKSLTRPFVREKIQQWQEVQLGKSQTDFPVNCLAQTKLDKLLNFSLHVERKFFGENYKARQESEHRKAFKQSTKARFCSVDTDAILQQADWNNFFQNISRLHS